MPVARHDRAERSRLSPAIRTFLMLAVLLASLLAMTARSDAARPLDISFSDYLYENGGKAGETAFDQTQSLNANLIRANLIWRNVAPTKPANPTDPADPAYNWAPYDAAVRAADAHGLDVNLTVFLAPDWAEGPNRPADTERYPPGSWKPDAKAYGEFATALATRYSGSYDPGPDVDPLPAVKYFEAWNEPNLSSFMTPQWSGKQNVSSETYVKLLNAFYDSVKDVDPDAEIVSAGTAPYGDPPGGPLRTQPVRFLQELLCLNTKNKKSSCPAGEAPKFDIIAHHPINRTDPPTAKAANKGDVEVADFGSLVKVLRAGEKQGTPATPGKHEVWANEIWWQTNPPDKAEGVSYKKQARWYQQAMYLLWKQGASNVTILQLRDAKYTPGEFTLASYQTGVFTYKGKAKPSATGAKFPFVIDGNGKRVRAWGKAPESGKLTIEAKGKGGYRRVTSFDVGAGKVFSKKIKLPDKGDVVVRAKVSGETSLPWDNR